MLSLLNILCLCFQEVFYTKRSLRTLKVRSDFGCGKVNLTLRAWILFQVKLRELSSMPVLPFASLPMVSNSKRNLKIKSNCKSNPKSNPTNIWCIFRYPGSPSWTVPSTPLHWSNWSRVWLQMPNCSLLRRVCKNHKVFLISRQPEKKLTTISNKYFIKKKLWYDPLKQISINPSSHLPKGAWADWAFEFLHMSFSRAFSSLQQHCSLQPHIQGSPNTVCTPRSCSPGSTQPQAIWPALLGH